MENEVRTREVGTRMMQDGTGVKYGEISLNFINGESRRNEGWVELGGE